MARTKKEETETNEMLESMVNSPADAEEVKEENKTESKGIAKSDDGRVHVMVYEPRAFNPNTGEKLSNDYEQTYGVKEWKSVAADALRKMNFGYKVLSHPDPKSLEDWQKEWEQKI